MSSYLNSEKLSKEKKVEINHKDSISFKGCEIELVFRIKEEKRERSRSKSPKKIEKEKKPSEVKEIKEEPKHIKSEVIWNAVEFENKNKKDKFLRLLGANKHKKESGAETNDANVSKNLSEQLTNSFKKIERDLEQQYLNSRGRK